MRAFANSGFFVANPLQAAALARLRQAATFPGGVAVLSGGPGVGKSALLRHALAPVVADVDVLAVDLRNADPAEFPEAFLDAIGPPGVDGADHAPARLRAALAARRASGRPLVLAIDVAGLNVDLARRLLRFVHVAGEQQSPVALVLQGPHTLHQLLDVPGLIQLRQRLSYRLKVRPLTLLETAAYIRHCLTDAGVNPDEVLAVNAPAAVYLYVAGVPRLVNTLMDAALGEVQARQAGPVDADLVRQVAEQLGWKPLGARGAAAGAASVSVGAASAAKAVPPSPTRRSADRPTTRAAMAEAPPPPPAEPLPASDMTRRLQVAAAAPAPATPVPAEAPGPVAERRAAPAARPAPPVPMDESDTGATGMLKLEDLDERFAETLFSEDSGHFKALIDAGKSD
jgi:general secretion pathway protein A